MSDITGFNRARRMAANEGRDLHIFDTLNKMSDEELIDFASKNEIAIPSNVTRRDTIIGFIQRGLAK